MVTEQLKSGVYLITNTMNGKVYVGSGAISIKLRWTRHKMLLKARKHWNQYLQNAWNKYGKEAFRFEVLIRCAPKDCILHEQFFIDKYRSADRKLGYNISPTAGNCLGTVHTDETRAKMSEAHRGKKKSFEHAAKVAAANRGQKRSAESRAKMSAAKKGKRQSAEHIAKMVASKTGKPLSAEHKEKLSYAAKQRDPNCYKKAWETRIKRGSVGKPIEYRGRFQTAASWARELGLNRYIIHLRLNRGWSVVDALETPIRKVR